MVKTAVIGASGFIGKYLWLAYRAVYPNVVGTNFSKFEPELIHWDIRDPKIELLRLKDAGYGAVLIASAKPNIAYCEQNPNSAYEVNVRGTLDLARQVHDAGLQTIFLSTDYVFDGNTGRYDDNAPTLPTTVYGKYKVETEQKLPTITDNYLIIRLSKIFGLQKGDNTLIDDIAGALAKGRQISCAFDQIFCPTFVEDLVKAIIAIQDRGLKGVLNVCSPDICSRYDVAVAVAEAMNVDRALVRKIPLHDVPAMAGRPLNTSMICTRLTTQVGPKFTPLDSCIKRVAANWRS